MRWIRHNPDLAAAHKQAVFSTVRFPLVTRRFLTTEVKDEPLLQDSCHCLKLVLGEGGKGLLGNFLSVTKDQSTHLVLLSISSIVSSHLFFLVM